MIEFLLNNNFLLSVVAFALILIPAIIIHELGHFFAAKLAGINVLEFGIGFPPRMFKLFMWGETEFTLNWLPIGGFVRPLGENMIGPVADTNIYDLHSEEDFADEKPKKSEYMTEREELMARGVPEDKLMSVNDAKPLPRIFFMVAGALANVVSAIVVFIIAALIGIPVEVGARVQLFEIGDTSVFNQPGVEIGDAVERIDGEYFSSHATFLEQWQSLRGKTTTLTMRHPDEEDGTPGAQYEITVTPDVSTVNPYVFVMGVVEESPAHQAGIRPADLIKAVDGRPLTIENPVAEIQMATSEAAGRGLTFTILRNGQSFDVFLVPRLDPPAGEGRIGIGIKALYETSDGSRFMDANSQFELIPQPIGTAVNYGFMRTWSTLRMMASIPKQIIEGTISPEEARPVSIIGISQIGGQFLQRSIREGSPSVILEFLALVSIFLGATNLLPFPPLDGGRILFVVIEVIRGKPVSPHIENRIHYIGIVILLTLGLIIIIYDIFNPLTLS